MKQRNTVQRTLVMEAAKALHHPTADEIYHKIAAAHPTVSRGTVYRNLSLLVGQGALRKVAVPDAADRFDITLQDHYHIQCRVCGRVADADLPYQTGLLSRVGNSGGYRVEDHDIILRGVCPDCQRQTENANHTTAVFG